MERDLQKKLPSLFGKNSRELPGDREPGYTDKHTRHFMSHSAWSARH